MNHVIEMFMLLVQKQEDRQAPFKLMYEPCFISVRHSIKRRLESKIEGNRKGRAKWTPLFISIFNEKDKLTRRFDRSAHKIAKCDSIH